MVILKLKLIFHTDLFSLRFHFRQLSFFFGVSFVHMCQLLDPIPARWLLLILFMNYHQHFWCKCNVQNKNVFSEILHAQMYNSVVVCCAYAMLFKKKNNSMRLRESDIRVGRCDFLFEKWPFLRTCNVNSYLRCFLALN